LLCRSAVPSLQPETAKQDENPIPTLSRRHPLYQSSWQIVYQTSHVPKPASDSSSSSLFLTGFLPARVDFFVRHQTYNHRKWSNQMNNKENLRILFICDDDAIRFARELMLQELGCQVNWLPSNAPLTAANIRSLSVAIICQSVNWKRAAHLSTLLRRLNPSMNILRINTLRSEMESQFNVDCEVVTGPGALIQTLDSLTEKHRQHCVVGP
jgi:hypothetical protein